MAQKTLNDLPRHCSIDLTIRKPSALPFATPSISITRSAEYYAAPRPPPGEAMAVAGPSSSSSSPSLTPRIFVALGSNIGDRMGNIRRAVRLLEQEGVRCTATGRMYESEPMYVEDQARFANTVIEVRSKTRLHTLSAGWLTVQVVSDLEPLPLLRVLKKVERATGRTKTFTNGPRVVDLDLLFYGDRKVRVGQKGDADDESGVGWLELPHCGIAEREFVLRPLNEQVILPLFAWQCSYIIANGREQYCTNIHPSYVRFTNLHPAFPRGADVGPRHPDSQSTPTRCIGDPTDHGDLQRHARLVL